MATEHPKGEVRKVMAACLAGQVVEWFDYGLYGLLAAHIAVHFFPSDDPMTGLLSTFAVFGVAFVVRPLGGVVLGRLGDVKGRHYVLVVSIILMTIATTVIGLTPGAAQIGIAAPLLLVLARALQGFSTAGESTSSTTYVAESVPEHRKGFYGAILIAGNSAGLLLATATIAVIQALMSEQAFAEWGWRTPFLIAVPMGGIAFYIRRKLEETPDFVRWQEEASSRSSP
jgi:MFS transporter, MHS family, proline/betaine transporter